MMIYTKVQYKGFIPALLGLSFFLMFGCASKSYRFVDSEPVLEQNDRRPIPVPKSNEYKRYSYEYDVLVRRPAVKNFECPKSIPPGI